MGYVPLHVPATDALSLNDALLVSKSENKEVARPSVEDELSDVRWCCQARGRPERMHDSGPVQVTVQLHVAHDGVRGAPDPLIAQQSARFTSGDEEDLSDGRRRPIR